MKFELTLRVFTACQAAPMHAPRSPLSPRHFGGAVLVLKTGADSVLGHIGVALSSVDTL